MELAKLPESILLIVKRSVERYKIFTISYFLLFYFL